MLFIDIKYKSDTPIYMQIYKSIKNRILEGILEGGTKLPSSRKLAGELGISRNCVVESYDLLIAEGFIHTKQGNGTYISEGTSLKQSTFRKADLLKDVGFKPFRTDVIDFRSGLPDLKYFPVQVWNRLSREMLEKIKPLDLSYQSPEGRFELRKSISDYLSISRGTVCTPDQIVITAGTTQAIGIITQLLAGKTGKPVIIEDPVTLDIPLIITGRNGKVIPLKADDNGIDINLIDENIDPSFIYTTPSHQYPLGTILPAKKRIELIKYAEKHNSYIIEDDYDSEFRYDGHPLSSIQSLNPDRVIYIGTFSKTLFPALRTAFIVLPQILINKGREIKWQTDLHNASLDQLILSEFINKGHYSRHISKMKKIYRKRRDFISSYLYKMFGNDVKITGESTGLHLCAGFSGIVFNRELLSRLEKNGAVVYPVESHCINKNRFSNTVILGYGMLDTVSIKKGIDIIYKTIR